MSYPYGNKTNKYDYASFNVANTTSDYDVKTEESDTFNNHPTYGLVEITTDATISVKFNSTSNPAITITSSQSPYVRDDLVIQNIYISNASGGAAAVGIYGNQI